MYTLWISLPTENAAGDITITNGLGKFYTFYWGVGRWNIMTRDEREADLDAFLGSIPSQPRTIEDGFNIEDARAIYRAVLDNELSIEKPQAKNLPSIKDLFPYTHQLLD